LLKDTCGILEQCHDGDLCTIDTAQYENNEWICKFEEIDCSESFGCDGSSCILQPKLTAKDGTVDDRFVQSIAISGDVLVVGLYGEAAYVFEKNDDNSWTQTAKLTSDDGMDDDLFGRSVDVFGDTIIVGASWHNTTGAAYIYSRQDGGNWTQAAKVTASDGVDGDYFGQAVAASENLVVVGTFTLSGAVYIFQKHALSGIWKERTKLPIDVYSEALSVSGNVFTVGSPNFQSVIVFERNEMDGKWARTTKLTSPNGGHGFGNSVAVDGDVMIAGAPFSDSYKGAVYVYEKNQTAWELTANLTADDGSDGDNFGWSVGISDGILVVGAFGDDSSTGSVYTFQKHAGNWTQMNKVTANDGKSKVFGYSVDINGDIVAVGAINDDGIGSVYLNKLRT
jgi:hypothetical protein